MEGPVEMKEIARAAARAATEGVARLLGAPAPEAPTCQARSLEELRSDCAAHPGAVVAELEGAAGGPVALLFTPQAAHELLVRMVGDGPAASLDDRARSALRELGNVAFSGAAGAIGDGLGGIVFPTVPRLVGEMVSELTPERLGAGVDTLEAWVARTEPLDRGGRLELLFVWLPQPGDGRLTPDRTLS